MISISIIIKYNADSTLRQDPSPFTRIPAKRMGRIETEWVLERNPEVILGRAMGAGATPNDPSALLLLAKWFYPEASPGPISNP
jgi:hypothetical protein